MKNEIKCYYAEEWTFGGTLYKCSKKGFECCQGDYGGVKYCKPLIVSEIEKREEKSGLRALETHYSVNEDGLY
jgi:hypothetical protein